MLDKIEDESVIKNWQEHPISKWLLKLLEEDIYQYSEMLLSYIPCKMDNCLDIYFHKGIMLANKRIYELLNDKKQFLEFINNKIDKINEKEQQNENVI